MFSSALVGGVLAALAHAALIAPNTGFVDAGWNIEDVALVTNNERIDLEISPGGVPFLVFDGDQGIRLMRRLDHGTWQEVPFPYDGRLPVLDFDAVNGLLHVLFLDAASGNLDLAARYGVFGMPDTYLWLRSTAGGPVAQFDFRMLDKTAHIVQYAATWFSYNHYDPDFFSWTTQLTRNLATYLSEPAIVLDSGGVPRIGYSETGDFMDSTTLNQTQWNTAWVAPAHGGAFERVSLALTSDDLPRAAFRATDPGNPDTQLRYAFFEHGTGWVTQFVDSDGGSLGLDASLALDPVTGLPRIASYGSGCYLCLSEGQNNGMFLSYRISDVDSARHKLVITDERIEMIAFLDQSNGMIRVAVSKGQLFEDGFESQTMSR